MTVKQRRSPGRTRSDRHVQPQSTSLNCKQYEEMCEKCSWRVQPRCTNNAFIVNDLFDMIIYISVNNFSVDMQFTALAVAVTDILCAMQEPALV